MTELDNKTRAIFREIQELCYYSCGDEFTPFDSNTIDEYVTNMEENWEWGHPPLVHSQTWRCWLAPCRVNCHFILEYTMLLSKLVTDGCLTQEEIDDL